MQSVIITPSMLSGHALWRVWGRCCCCFFIHLSLLLKCRLHVLFTCRYSSCTIPIRVVLSCGVVTLLSPRRRILLFFSYRLFSVYILFLMFTNIIRFTFSAWYGFRFSFFTVDSIDVVYSLELRQSFMKHSCRVVILILRQQNTVFFNSLLAWPKLNILRLCMWWARFLM